MQYFKVKYVNLKIFLLAIGLGLSLNATSQTIVNAAGENVVMTPEYHSVEMKGIKDQYQIELEDCALITGNAMQLCNVQAMAKQNIDLAKLENDYHPTTKNRLKANVVKVNADYAVAIERCADMTGAEKIGCMKEAKTAKIAELVKVKSETP